MMPYVLPVLATLLVWWLTTGIVLHLINRDPATYRWSLSAATVVLVGALVVLARCSTAATVVNAYLGFLCGVLIWGWVEMSYSMGLVTGPRPQACPPRVTAWRRFSLAVQASLYHELAILALAGLMVALTWGAPNQVGTWTFVILWLMRWSAKLNIFLGVRNLNLQWFPDHLRYLESFIVRRRMNPLFPVSIVLATAAAAWVLSGASGTGATAADVAAAWLLGTLILLAILEHVFLVVPLPDAALWNWALPARSDARGPQDPTSPISIDRRHRSTRPLAGLDAVPICGASAPRSAATNSGR